MSDAMRSPGRFLRSHLRTLISVTLSVAFFAYILFSYDFSDAFDIARKIPIVPLAAILGLLAGHLLLSSARFDWIVRDFGITVAYSRILRSNIYGHLAGSFLNLIGQMATRGALLRRHGVPVSSTVAITFYERIVGLAILFAASAMAVYYLFGAFEFVAGQDWRFVATVFVVLAIAVTGAAVIAFPDLASGLLRTLAGPRFRVSLIRTGAVTIVLHALMAASYVIALRAFAPGLPPLSMAAATVIVMLAAAMPISLNGWGVREVSAIYVFGKIGVAPEQAIAVSVLIGLLSYFVLLVFGALVALTGVSRPRPADIADDDAARGQPREDDAIGRAINRILPVIAAVFVFFQVHVVIAGTKVNVNLADPVIVIAGGLFLYRLIFVERRLPAWRVPRLTLFLTALTVVIVAGFVNGYFAFGVTGWALTNRLLGWPVLLGYLGTGALAVLAGGAAGRETLLRTIAVAAAVVVLAGVTLSLLTAVGMVFPQSILDVIVTGFAQNSNAYAFQLLLVAAIALVLAGDRMTKNQSAFGTVILGIAMAGLWFTGSRASLGALVIMIAMALPFRVVSPRRFAAGLGIAVGIVMLPIVLSYVARLVGGGIEDTGFRIIPRLVRQSSDNERLISIIGAIALWQQHPLFGAGLGAFMHQYLQAHGTPLVIHSTILWILAEFGLVGFAVFAGVTLRIIHALWTRRVAGAIPPPARIALLCLLGFGVASLVHDLLYQRLLWLILGATLAVPASPARPVSSCGRS